MNKTSTILKLALLTIMLLTGITYLIAPKQTNKPIKEKPQIPMKYTNLPKEIEIVGKEGLQKLQDIIKPNTQTIIAVANQDALPIITQYKQYYKNDINYVTVANISNAPWVLKKLGIQSILEKINTNSTSAMIYDSNGWFTKVLNLKDPNPIKYFIYKMNKNGDIEFLFENTVKSGLILEENIDQKVIKEALIELHNKLELSL